MLQVRSATRVEQVASCMLQLEANLRRGALSRDWDPLARIAARKAAASRAASEALPPVAESAQEARSAPVEAQPTTPQADNSAPGTPRTLAADIGKFFITCSRSCFATLLLLGLPLLSIVNCSTTQCEYLGLSTNASL